MELYLAGEHTIKNGSQANWKGLNILESYCYVRKNKFFAGLYPDVKNFLLDSGAFTFLKQESTLDWDRYVCEFAEFINKYNIKHFFELDIDSIVGLKEVERLRYKLECLTNKKPIVVWHPSRGKDYFVNTCKEYKYVAIGGIAGAEISKKTYRSAFPWFIKTAHEHNSRIHGLGVTRLEALKKCHFDSVDSTAWLYGNLGGFIYKFNQEDGTMAKYKAPKGYRLKTKMGVENNFNEWVKFQKYARFKL